MLVLALRRPDTGRSVSRRDGDDRLGRLEVLGAWLGLWTPPRGTTVPPVPKRALAITTVVLVATAGTLAAVMLPRVAADRRAAEERADRAQAQRHAAFLATVDRQQRPTTVHGRRDPGAAPDARRIAARRALLASAVADLRFTVRALRRR